MIICAEKSSEINYFFMNYVTFKAIKQDQNKIKPEIEQRSPTGHVHTNVANKNATFRHVSHVAFKG